jgi:hypothetical protein
MSQGYRKLADVRNISLVRKKLDRPAVACGLPRRVHHAGRLLTVLVTQRRD